MNILYLSHKNPVAMDEGAKIVIMGTIRHLARKGCKVSLVYLDSDANGSARGLDEYCARVVPVLHRRVGAFSRALQLVEGMYRNKPYTVEMFRNHDFGREIDRLVGQEKFDCVHMETALLYQYKDRLPGLPIVVRHHNLEAGLLRQQAENATGWLKKTILGRQAELLARYEADAVNGADFSVAITQADKESILREYRCSRPVEVIPAGIETDPVMPRTQQEHCLVFTGRVEWGPNLEGVAWFIKKVFPIISKRFPMLKLYIAGGLPPAWLKSFETDRVRITGLVDNPADYIDRAEVYIVPLRAGSGMRLKILEAMSRARAIVSTTKGAEGIACENGRNIMLADSAEEFAGSVIGLLEDKAAAAAMGAAAFTNVKNNYSWSGVADRFISVYSRCIDAGPTSATRSESAPRRLKIVRGNER